MITAVVLTKSNSKIISRTLSSLKFCSEIVVVDDYSTDNTVKIAQRFKARVFKRKLNNDFASQRNFGLSKAKSEWVLFVDSDEVVSSKLAKEIIKKTKENTNNGFYIKRRDYWLGSYINGGETNISILRLGRKSLGKWKRRVHEYWAIKGEVGNLDSELIHYPHENVREFISDINSYSQIHSAEIKKEGKSSSILKILLFPLLKFKVNFILKGGYKDRVHGFVIAGIMSFHSFLSWSNLWLTSRKK